MSQPSRIWTPGQWCWSDRSSDSTVSAAGWVWPARTPPTLTPPRGWRARPRSPATPATSTPSTTFGYFTFWQEFDDGWSVFHDCQIVGFELSGSTDDKFLAIKPTIIGMALEQKCAEPVLATAETDAYHWLDAGGYWALTGDLANMEHADVPTDIDELKAWLTAFKAHYNAHCAIANGRHHKAADAVNTLSYADNPADLAACIVCLTEIRADLIAHEANTTAHYFADTTDNKPSAAWLEPCVTLEDCLIAAEDLIGYVNAPGCYNRHLGAMPGIKQFALTVGTKAKAIPVSYTHLTLPTISPC